MGEHPVEGRTTTGEWSIGAGFSLAVTHSSPRNIPASSHQDLASSMHALVTGGGGFLGRYVVEQLIARGDRVRSFSRGAYPELASLGVEVIRGDIRSAPAVAAACAGVDCVFHTAAIAGVGGGWKDYYETNTRGTENVIAGCRVHHVPRLVYTSSPSVVFEGIDQRGIDEQVRYSFKWLRRHRCHYSRSKALAERAVLAANEPQIATCALRPHLVWGPRDNHLIPRLLNRARKGRLRRVGSGDNLVDVTYVENAAAAHLLASDALERRANRAASPTTSADDQALPRGPIAAGDADSGHPSHAAGRAYFLSQGEPVNCWSWIDQILALADLPAVRKSISAAAAWRIGACCEHVYRILRLHGEPPMTRFVAAQLATSHWFDVSRAVRDLDYRPLVSTEEGMQRLAVWLQRNR